MLPKKKRVVKGVFQVLIKEGKTFSSQLFLLHFKENNPPLFSTVAPKGIFKSAVKRNKYRRIGYNILRSLPINSGSGVFIYKKQAITASQKEIKENMVFLLKKTKSLS